METLLQDVKYGARLLVRNPGFAAIAVLSLALGIGANTAIFSVVQQVVASPFPVEQPERLLAFFTTDRRNPGNLPLSHLNFKDIRDQNTVFSQTAAFTFTQLNYLAGQGTSEQILAQVVTGNYFDTLGVRFSTGRGFRPEEDQAPGAGSVVVLSHGFWERHFGADPQIVGRTLSLNRQAFTVVGVAPRGFTGTLLFGAPDVWVPMSMHDVVQPGFDWYEGRRGLFLFAFGRLRPEAAPGQAQAQLAALGSQLASEYPNDNDGRSFGTVPLTAARINPQGDGGGPVVQASLLLMVIVGVVLLIACANIANLLLARGTARAREIAVRLAIGAGRRRLVRQLLTESLLLSLLGGALGLLVGYWTLELIRSAPIQLPPNFLEQVAIDNRVLAFTVGLSVLTGLLFGLVPSLRASRPDLVPTLKNETVPVLAGSQGMFRGIGLRQALVVGQVALSLIALIAGGLFLRSLLETQQIDPGFQTNRVLGLAFNLGREGYTAERGRQFHDRLLERAAGLPGVLTVSLAQNRPFQGGFARSVLLEGADTSEQNRTLVQVNTVSPAYFQTVGIPLLRGRDFTPQDTERSPLVVIINQTMADKFFAGTDPIGRRFRFFGDDQDTTIVGIARDAKYNGLVENPQPFAYLPMAQAYSPAANLLVRTSDDAGRLAADARTLFRQLDPQLTVLNVGTLQEQVDQALAPQRLIVTLLGVFGLLALSLAAIGLYGVASFSVTQRTREIGIRMALGATRRTVLGLVLLQGLTMVAVGIAVGLLVSWLVLARAVSALLVGVPPGDPITFAGMAIVLVAVSVLASYVPAHRATRIDPLLALRHE